MVGQRALQPQHPLSHQHPLVCAQTSSSSTSDDSTVPTKGHHRAIEGFSYHVHDKRFRNNRDGNQPSRSSRAVLMTMKRGTFDPNNAGRTTFSGGQRLRLRPGAATLSSRHAWSGWDNSERCSIVDSDFPRGSATALRESPFGRRRGVVFSGSGIPRDCLLAAQVLLCVGRPLNPSPSLSIQSRLSPSRRR